MDFAVVKIAGKQHLVSVGDTISIQADLGEVGKKLNFPEVLLLSLGDQISIGTPLVDKAEVATEVVFSGRGEKIRVSKFKAKARYRKTIGFRSNLTKLKIISIGSGVIARNEETKQSSPKQKKDCHVPQRRDAQ